MKRHGLRDPIGRTRRFAGLTLPPIVESARSWTVRAMSAVADTLGVLVRVLDSRRIGWFVFGAQAVAVRGAPRATQDVDVTVQIERSRLRELIDALAAEGLRHRYPDLADELLDRGAVLPLIHTSGMEVDLVVAGSGLEALALGRATRVAIEGVEVPVAQATDLPRRGRRSRRGAGTGSGEAPRSVVQAANVGQVAAHSLARLGQLRVPVLLVLVGYPPVVAHPLESGKHLRPRH